LRRPAPTREPPEITRGSADVPHLRQQDRDTLLTRGLLLVGAATVLSALSLLIPWSLAFDPQAWVVWGRDALDLSLDTRSGPSWKPLPVVVTTPLALAGDAAPALWMVVARTGGLLALAGAAVLATRLAGRAAGAMAVAVMALSPWWFYNTILGNSEGLLVAAVLWAVVAHLAGRERAALGLLGAASLLRPEVWPFLGLYALWLWRRDPAAGRGVAAIAVIVPLLWFGPDVLGIGGALTASHSARGEASLGSAALEDVPGLAVLADAVTLLTVPAALGAVVGVIAASRVVRILAAAALAWVALVAVMAQAGYAGNPRYLVVAVALGCVLAGVGAARAGQAVSPRARGAAAAVLVVAVALVTAGELRDQAEEAEVRAERREALPELVAAAGGRDALVSCSRVRTAPDARPLVAWVLDLPMLDLDAPPRPPAVVVRWQPHYPGPIEPIQEPARAGYRPLAQVPGWDLWAACGPAPQTTG
jgi:hypothetical protein